MENERKNRPSASGMDRLFSCPGSAQLEAVCQDVQTDDSKTGTHIHTVLAGDEEPESDFAEITAEDSEAIAQRIVSELGFNDAECFKEKRLWWDLDYFSGRVDRIYILEDRALILDFKTLFAKQKSASRSWQMRTYAVLVEKYFGAKSVTVGIISRWIKGQFTLCEYNAEALEKSKEAVLGAVAASDIDGAQRIPGNHCKFCKGLSVCPEARSSMTAMIDTDSREVTENLPKWLNSCELAEAVVKAIRAEAKRRLLENPNSIPGWRMAPGNERRVVPNNAKLFFAMQDAIGMSMGDFLGACKVTLGTLKNIHKDKTLLKGKDQQKAFDALIEPCVVKVQNAPSLEKIS